MVSSACSSFSYSFRINVMSLTIFYFSGLNSELSSKHDNYKTLICHISQGRIQEVEHPGGPVSH